MSHLGYRPVQLITIKVQLPLVLNFVRFSLFHILHSCIKNSQIVNNLTLKK